MTKQIPAKDLGPGDKIYDYEPAVDVIAQRKTPSTITHVFGPIGPADGQQLTVDTPRGQVTYFADTLVTVTPATYQRWVRIMYNMTRLAEPGETMAQLKDRYYGQDA